MNHQEIKKSIIEYLCKGNPLLAQLEKIPCDESLVELGYMDSFGVIDIVIFLEGTYKIKILDDEITKEKFGSINKMSTLVLDKL